MQEFYAPSERDQSGDQWKPVSCVWVSDETFQNRIDLYCHGRNEISHHSVSKNMIEVLLKG